MTIFKLILFIIVALCGFGREAGAAVSLGAKETDPRLTCIAMDPAVVYRPRPQCRERLTRAGMPYETWYNDLGLRDQNYLPRAKRGWSRILFVGSSHLAAPGLAASETPPKIFEKKIKKKIPKVEVINGGVEGYKSTQVAILLRELLPAYSPTHVLFSVDFQTAISLQDLILRLELLRDQQGKPERVGWDFAGALERIPKLKYWLMDDYQNRYGKVMALVYGVYGLAQTWKCKIASRGQDELNECMLAPSLEMIRFMQDSVRATGGKFLVSIPRGRGYSTDIRVAPGWSVAIAKAIDTFMPKVDIPVESVIRLLEKREISYIAYDLPVGPEYFLPKDHHYSRLGAEVYSDRILKEVMPVWFPARKK